MDAESVRALMSRYYAVMRRAVETQGGKVVKFVGDGAMAVFGVPEVAEDDAQRAVRAAVDPDEPAAGSPPSSSPGHPASVWRRSTSGARTPRTRGELRGYFESR